MKQKTRVLYVITKADVGGAQKYVHDLAANLDRAAFTPQTLYGGADIRWLSNATHPELLFANDWLAVFELVRLYRRLAPNIVHLNSSKAGVLGALAARLYNAMRGARPKLRVVFTAHGWVFNPTNALAPLTRLCYRLLHRVAGYAQNAVICVSQYDKELALSHRILPLSKLTVIHNGVAPNISPYDRRAARAAIIERLASERIPLEARWIGSIGRLTKEKNYETFIEAAYHMPHTYCFVIGDGVERAMLAALIARRGLPRRFFIVPPQGDDARLLPAFDVFVMSSIKEGLPYTLLEAMMARCSIVVTHAGGMPEAIRDGENGMVVPQRDPAALSRAVELLLTDESLARRMRSGAYESAAREFTLERMVRETESVYRRLSPTS